MGRDGRVRCPPEFVGWRRAGSTGGKEGRRERPGFAARERRAPFGGADHLRSRRCALRGRQHVRHHPCDRHRRRRRRVGRAALRSRNTSTSAWPRTSAPRWATSRSTISRCTRRRTTCTCRSSVGTATTARAVLVRIDGVDGCGDVALDDVPVRVGEARRRARRPTTADSTSPLRRERRGAHVRRADHPHPAPPHPHVDRHRHGATSTAPSSSPGSRTRSSHPSCAASRSRSTRAATDNNLEIFHVSHGQVGDRRPDPDVRPLRRRAQHPGQLHLHAGRALPARDLDARAPRSSAAPSPSSAP